MSLWRTRLWRERPEAGEAQVVLGIKTEKTRMETSGKKINEEQAMLAAKILFMKPNEFHQLKQLMEKHQ